MLVWEVYLTAACEKAQCVSMAKLLRYGSDVSFNITDMVVTLLRVQGIDYHVLLSLNLESMTCEDHDDEEVHLGSSPNSLLEVGAGGIDHFLV